MEIGDGLIDTACQLENQIFLYSPSLPLTVRRRYVHASFYSTWSSVSVETASIVKIFTTPRQPVVLYVTIIVAPLHKLQFRSHFVHLCYRREELSGPNHESHMANYSIMEAEMSNRVWRTQHLVER
jgi:hypothetical protein